ncbi:uncharacterized protein LOC126682041 [Mercurialis annua]|uniref:uncharacterized protein LOC126682041 n=1 Tax=Mercurialis annua TaxID=3986 RepID=UPI00215FB6C1|nr:uncharacterized protein LOC126682041 [Mercurialis annua]
MADGNDSLYWSPNSNGNFSVSSAYKMHNSSQLVDDNRNKLLTNYERGRRHMTDDVSCRIYGHHTEDIDHRNNFVFNKNKCSSVTLALEVCWMVDYTTQAQRYALLSNPSLRSKHEVLIGWSPPSPFVLKINTDGALRASENKAASGGVARNNNDDWVFGFSRSIGYCSVIQAKLWEALEGLYIASNKGFRIIILEMDGLLAVEGLMRNDTTINANTNPLLAIRNLMRWDWHVCIQHILGKATIVPTRWRVMASLILWGCKSTTTC